MFLCDGCVHELLRYLESVDFPYAPRVLGFDELGREVLTHLAEAGVRSSTGAVICHGDFGPWNLVWRDGHPVGILDWDHARLAPSRYDVPQALGCAAWITWYGES